MRSILFRMIMGMYEIIPHGFFFRRYRGLLLFSIFLLMAMPMMLMPILTMLVNREKTLHLCPLTIMCMRDKIMQQ